MGNTIGKIQKWKSTNILNKELYPASQNARYVR